MTFKTEGWATGVSAPVGNAHAPGGETGIGFSTMGGTVVIAITRNGEGLAVALKGDDLDTIAGFMADVLTQATRHDHPSLGSIQ